MSKRSTRTLRLNPVLSAMVTEIMLWRGTEQMQQFIESLIRDEWDRRKGEMSRDAIGHVTALVDAERTAMLSGRNRTKTPESGRRSGTVQESAESRVAGRESSEHVENRSTQGKGKKNRPTLRAFGEGKPPK